MDELHGTGSILQIEMIHDLDQQILLFVELFPDRDPG